MKGACRWNISLYVAGGPNRNSDYIGQLGLESGRRYQVGVRVVVNRDGEQEFWLYARRLQLRGSTLSWAVIPVQN